MESESMVLKITKALEEGPFKIAKLAKKISRNEPAHPTLKKIADSSKFWNSNLSFMAVEIVVCIISTIIGYLAWCIVGDNTLVFYTYAAFATTCTIPHTIICSLKSQDARVTASIGGYSAIIYATLIAFAYYNFTQSFNETSIKANFTGYKLLLCIFASIVFTILAGVLGFFLISMFRNQCLTRLMKEYLGDIRRESDEDDTLEGEDFEEILEEVVVDSSKLV